MFELSGTHCHAIWHHDGTQDRPTARQYVPVWTLCRMLMKAAGLTAGCQIVRLSRAFIAINDSRMRRRRRGELSWWGRLLRPGRGGRGRGRAYCDHRRDGRRFRGPWGTDVPEPVGIRAANRKTYRRITTSCGRRSSMWGSSSARRRASSGSALSRAFCFGPSSGWHPATSACPCWAWRRRSLEGVEFDEIEQVLVRVPHLCRSTRKAGRPPPWRSRCCADRPVWVAVRFRCSDLWIGRGGRRARAGGHLGFRTAPRRVRCPRRHRRSWRRRRWPPRRAERRALRARPASCPSAARR